MYRWLIAVLLVSLLTGCFKLPWALTPETEYIATEHNMAMTLPQGWMLSSRDDVVLLTRDGVLLQYVVVETIHVDNDLTNTKKHFKRNMLPLEQAEVILDNMSTSDNYTGFKVTKKAPAKVAGHQAFSAEYRFKDEDGLVYNGVMYGFMQNDWFYGVYYVAPKRHYFPRDKAKFEKLIKSIKLLV